MIDKTDSGSRRYMVDGSLRGEDEIRRMFDNGEVDLQELSPREKIALNMVGEVCQAGQLLDVGCYAGGFLKAIQGTDPRLDFKGVDSYEDNISIAHLLYPEWKSRITCQSVYDLKFGDESFDCVTFKEVIEHIDRPVDAVQEINRVMRVGGHLILSTPNANARAWRLFFASFKWQAIHALKRKPRLGPTIFFENVDWNRHLYAWTAETLYTLLYLNGFEYVEHQFYQDSLLERIFPLMGNGLVFLVKKTGRPQQKLI